MQGLTSRLRNKLTLYAKQPSFNELGEDTFKYVPVGTMYGEIITWGGSNAQKVGNTTQSSTSHRLTIRSKSVRELSNDMYFVYKDQRYDIEYFNPNYKYDDSVEILIKLIDGVYKND